MVLFAIGSSAYRQADLMAELEAAKWAQQDVHYTVIEALLYDEKQEFNRLCNLAMAWWALQAN